MANAEQAFWEEHFCLPFYRSGCKDVNTAYMESHCFYASCCREGAREELWGLFATSGGTDWAGLNFAFLTEPVRSVERFQPRLARAAEFYRQRGLPWILAVPDLWVAPDRREGLHLYLQAQNFQLAVEAHAVETNSVTPAAELDCRIRPVDDLQGWETVARIGAESWSVTPRALSPLFESLQFQQGARGYLGFADGEPIAAVATLGLNGYHYLSWLATLPGYRRRGTSERLVRHAAAMCEPGQPILAIASPQTLQTCLRCGFRKGERFRLYLAPGA